MSGGVIIIPVTGIINLDDLIIYVRLKVGDTVSTAYRYTDEWIRTGLVAAVQYLQRWMNYKYLLDVDGDIYRNPNYPYFIFDETTYGIIESGDIPIIVIAAAYLILEGSLQNAAWDFASWKDAEISYSNLESSRARGGMLDRLWNELQAYLKPPTKRLAQTRKNSLPGYINNDYETGNTK
jgi:hypothetical protein